MHVPIRRNRLQKRVGLELGLTNASWPVCEFLDRCGIVNLGGRGPAAGGIQQGEFGDEPDAAAGIEARLRVRGA
jgi:hypothetical protein